MLLSAPSTPLSNIPSNLKEAIGWILRVTGKYGGGGGPDGTNALAKQVQNLLTEVQDSSSGTSVDIKKVIQALDGSGNGLIGKLAEGLAKFIGYEGGKLSDQSTPKLTGGGILPANAAKYQVCNAVLNFVIRFLEGLLGSKASGHGEVLKVIATLRKCVGTGQVPGGFGELVKKIEEKVQTNSGFSGQVGQSLKTMFEKLKAVVNGHESGDRIDNLQTFLEQVIKGPNNEQSNDFQNLCDELKKLFEGGTLTSGMTTADTHLELTQLNGQITTVTKQANKINPSSFKTSGVAKALAAGVKSGAYAFLAEIK